MFALKYFNGNLLFVLPTNYLSKFQNVNELIQNVHMINALISNPNHQLDSCTDSIHEAISLANKYAPRLLGIKKNIDILFTDAFYGIIPEENFGAYTHSSDFIKFTVKSNSILETYDILNQLMHELAHAVRWQSNNEYSDTLLKTLIFEGIATAFSIEAQEKLNVPGDFFIKTIRNTSEKKILESLSAISGELSDSHFNDNRIFAYTPDSSDLPRWTGYKIGYYLVCRYLELTNQKASGIIDIKYQTIIDKLEATKII